MSQTAKFSCHIHKDVAMIPVSWMKNRNGVTTSTAYLCPKCRDARKEGEPINLEVGPLIDFDIYGLKEK